MSKYTQNKESLREEAINWQHEYMFKSKSYGELLEENAYFMKYGKRYGLLKEFRENGII